MAVLVYLDNSNGKIPKSGLEVAYYGSRIAKDHKTEAIAVVIGDVDDAELKVIGKYGIDKSS